MGKLIGYARVSTGEQNLQLQLDALKTAGCSNDDIYMDKASGARGSRPGLDACVAALEPGDTLIVWRLDRLGRSMPLGGAGGGATRQGNRLPVTSGRRHRHHHGIRRSDVQHLLEPGAVRAALDPGAHPGRLGRHPGTRAKGRSAADQSRRPACRDRQAPASGPRAEPRPDLQDLGDFQANVLPISGAAKRHQ